jgi:hypothetical protein
MSTKISVEKIPTSSLIFDPNNPRFYRLNDSHSVDQVIEEMLDDENVQDLMLSIGQKGYFEGEPLLVINVEAEYVVIEGNRRLAATKLLNREIPPPARKKNSVEAIINDVIIKPTTELPCLVYKDKKDILRYLGYRHITGIKNWDSLSKSLYISELKDTFYSGQSEENQLKSLAKDIGSRSDYVRKLLTALKLYKASEEKNFYGLHIRPEDVEFSFLTTAIGYESIQTWLNIEDPNSLDLPDLNMDHLRNLFSWMFSKDQQGETILGESRNIRKLSAIVSNDKAVKVLIDTSDIKLAYLFSDGPIEALNNAFEAILKQADTIWGLLNQVDIEPGHLDASQSLFDKSKRIKNTIQGELDER